MSEWHTVANPGPCPWGCGRRTTHVAEWPAGAVDIVDDDGSHPFDGQVRTYACADDAMKITTYQCSVGTDVVVREVGEGNW